MKISSVNMNSALELILCGREKCGLALSGRVYILVLLIAFRSVSTDGELVSLADSSLNILQENPIVPIGCISLPSTNNEGDSNIFSDHSNPLLLYGKECTLYGLQPNVSYNVPIALYGCALPRGVLY